MTRGTTPEIVATIRGTNLQNLSELYVTVKQGAVAVEKTMDDVLITDHRVHAMLTQDETLLFASGRDAHIQVRGLTNDGEAWATNVARLPVFPVIKEGVI